MAPMTRYTALSMQDDDEWAAAFKGEEEEDKPPPPAPKDPNEWTAEQQVQELQWRMCKRASIFISLLHNLLLLRVHLDVLCR